MFGSFYPNETQDSAYTIPYERLAERGVRGLLFDIDNTLVMHGASADARSIALFVRLHALGFVTCLLSNNQDPRVSPFAAAVESAYICDAHKPSARSYRKACEVLHVKPEETVFIGDQIFTDIWGSNRAGIRSILVKPIAPREEIQIVLKRIPEHLVLAAYRHGGRESRSRIL